MPERAAEELLRTVIGRKQAFSAFEKQELVKPIFEEKGCLPLALFIAGCMVDVAEGMWGPVVQAFRGSGVVDESKIAMPGSRGEDQEMRKTIRKVIEASVRFMEDESTQNALLQLGVLPVNTVVKLDVVKKLWDDHVDTRGMVDRLRRHGLVRASMNEVGEIGGIELHTVIGAYALDELGRVGGEREAHERIVSAYRVQHGWGGITIYGLDWFPLWEVADDGYLYDNIARHAEGAANAGVAGCVARQEWETARDRQRVGVAFKNDAEHAIRTVCAAFDGDKYAGEARRGLCYDADCAFYYRRYGDRRENVEDSIMWLERSWSFARGAYILICLDLCLIKENVEEAIAHFEHALTVRTREALPYEWAVTNYSLGCAYSVRRRGDGSRNAARAVELFAESLRVHTREAYPTDWADTTYKLMEVQYNRRNASAALECAVQLEVALAAIQRFSSDKRDLLYLVKASSGKCPKRPTVGMRVLALGLAVAISTSLLFRKRW